MPHGVKEFLENLLAKESLKKAEKAPPAAEKKGTGDQSYIRREIEKAMKKKKEDAKKASPATNEAWASPNTPKRKGY